MGLVARTESTRVDLVKLPCEQEKPCHAAGAGIQIGGESGFKLRTKSGRAHENTVIYAAS